MQNKKKQGLKPNISASILVAVTYVLLLLVRIFGIVEIGGENEYISIIVLQLMIFLLPAVIYCKLRGKKISDRLRIRLFGAEQLIFTVLASGLLISGSLLLNLLLSAGGAEQEFFSLYKIFSAPDRDGAETFLYVTLAYAALPAFCEEFLFRAVLSAEYERYGIICASVVSSVFFALLHFDFLQLIPYLFAGLVLHITLLATRSFFGSVTVHFLFNMYGLYGQGFVSEVYNTTGSSELFMIIVVTVFLLFLTMLCGQASRIYRRYANRGIPSDYHVKPQRGETVQNLADALLAPPCLVCYVIFVIIAAFF